MSEYVTFGNKVAAVDVETTGLKAGWHDIIQVACVLLDDDLEPHKDVPPFYMNMRPKHPERVEPRAMRVNKLTMDDLMKCPEPERVADLFMEWFDDLDLPFSRCIIPMAHNIITEHSFLTAWLGWDLKTKMFHGHGRDAMAYAISINDKYVYAGLPVPFRKMGLTDLCAYFGIVNENPHDALGDCYAEAKVYKALLKADQKIISVAA